MTDALEQQLIEENKILKERIEQIQDFVAHPKGGMCITFTEILGKTLQDELVVLNNEFDLECNPKLLYNKSITEQDIQDLKDHIRIQEELITSYRSLVKNVDDHQQNILQRRKNLFLKVM